MALRVEHLDDMQKFYEGVIGLELMTRFPTVAFFESRKDTAGTRKYLHYLTAEAQLATAGSRLKRRPWIILPLRSTWLTTSRQSAGWNNWD